jgi:hypothetical protein
VEREHLVVLIIRQHVGIERKQMRTQNKCERSGKEQCNRDTDQIHDSDTFVIEGESPGLPSFRAIQKRRFGRIEKLLTSFFICHFNNLSFS